VILHLEEIFFGPKTSLRSFLLKTERKNQDLQARIQDDGKDMDSTADKLKYEKRTAKKTI